jgi:hypothetical protein
MYHSLELARNERERNVMGAITNIQGNIFYVRNKGSNKLRPVQNYQISELVGRQYHLFKEILVVFFSN